MSKNKASYALWEAGHRTLSRNLKNLTREEFEKIFGEKKELSLISQFVSKSLKGHSCELLGKVYISFNNFFFNIIVIYI